MIPRIGHAPDATRKYTARPGAYAILPLRGRVLLTVQVTDEIDVQLPGGGIDHGENPVQALHREVLEETGWRIANPRRFGVFRRFVFMPEYDLWAEKICTIYVARPTVRLGPPTEPGHEALLLDAGSAGLALGNPGDRFFARQFARNGGVTAR